MTVRRNEERGSEGLGTLTRSPSLLGFAASEHGATPEVVDTLYASRYALTPCYLCRTIVFFDKGSE